ncbi:uncharacterized protein JN550_013375 [Neoarthrinium moseri]|uniref:uncharacterized protein n=1 Tax=Neoarthrinium moseri TaxID=1658444 RepID=UPI001FDCC103|nr:uncharacterized protein JN550_013375 [Neoarthrinium moseri]KAI1857240.1 hypothetical protein JN550_013375 [Neoarthrinium moseri]
MVEESQGQGQGQAGHTSSEPASATSEKHPAPGSSSANHDAASKRRRGLGIVTPNACTECRKKRAKVLLANPGDPAAHRENNHHILKTIQASGSMSLRDVSCERGSESWCYAGRSVRMAIEMGLHRLCDDGDEDEIAVQGATFWGALALSHAWSLATSSLPQSSCFSHLPPKPAILDDVEASLWAPYTNDELSELVQQSLYVLHSPGKSITRRELLNIYTQYLNWYDRTPEVLRLGHKLASVAVARASMICHSTGFGLPNTSKTVRPLMGWRGKSTS